MTDDATIVSKIADLREQTERLVLETDKKLNQNNLDFCKLSIALLSILDQVKVIDGKIKILEEKINE